MAWLKGSLGTDVLFDIPKNAKATLSLTPTPLVS